jgi:uridine kinase
MMTYDMLIDKIKIGQSLVIAIDGPSGSGKSTLANELAQSFSCTVFHTDDYFLPKNMKTKERLMLPGANLHYDRMLEEVFNHIDEPYITSNHFNCNTDQLEYRDPTEVASAIIIEGVYSMHPVFQPFYDVMVFLEVDEDTQKRRILSRSNEHMLKRYLTEWIPLENQYFDAFDIRNNADLIHKVTI